MKTTLYRCWKRGVGTWDTILPEGERLPPTWPGVEVLHFATYANEADALLAMQPPKPDPQLTAWNQARWISPEERAVRRSVEMEAGG